MLAVSALEQQSAVTIMDAVQHGNHYVSDTPGGGPSLSVSGNH